MYSQQAIVYLRGFFGKLKAYFARKTVFERARSLRMISAEDRGYVFCHIHKYMTIPRPRIYNTLKEF